MQQDFCITVAGNFNIDHFCNSSDAKRELSTPGRLTWAFSTKKRRYLSYLGREERISIVFRKRGDDIYRLYFGRKMRTFIVFGERGEHINHIWGER